MKSQPVRILVVDDEEHVRTSLACWFREEGFDVATASSGREALATLVREGAEILLVDIKMPGMDGLELQRRVRELAPDATVIIMTAYAAVDTAVQAMKEGAYDYVVKPFEPESLSQLVRKAAERYALLKENRALKAQLAASVPLLITRGGRAMGSVLELIRQVAPTDTNVLITGESGTGKELVARRIHGTSRRQFGPFVPVHCGALAEGILESELFGHEKGAFTGAINRKLGKIELAAEGTLFLDEIGDIPPKVQVDLLRVLQERSFTRVGGNEPIQSDFRLICATLRDLEAEVAAGRFREDLYYRINVLRIHIPPLRERVEDIPLLAEHFLHHFARQMGKKIRGFTPEAMTLLCHYPWPGNVRELANAVERAVVLCERELIPPELFPFSQKYVPADDTLAAVEAHHIRRVLAAHGWNITQAAKILGIDRVTLYHKMKRYNISRP
ncbi:MAG: sigma-54-dependent transcriptional regulator [Thermoanaerobaculaceae bacterium]